MIPGEIQGQCATCAAWKTRLEPDLEPNSETRDGEGPSIGSLSAIAKRCSSGPTTFGTM